MSASIIESLSISGSRLTDGTANASGKVWAYLPDTSTSTPLYSDPEGTLVLTQPIVLNQAGQVPAATAPDGVFTSIPIRLYIEDADGVVVSDSLFTPAAATNVSLDNEGWTGPTEDDAWTALFTSVGGVDGKYKESGGAASRTIKSKFAEDGVSVLDFADVDPTGVGISTTGFQAAFNRAATLSVNVKIPAGIYKTDQAITLPASTGVRVIGQGRGVVLIKPTHATANAFTFTACADSGISGLSILHTTGSTGAGIAVGGASPNFVAKDLYIPANGTFVGFDYGIDFSGASDFDLIENIQINANLVGLRENATSSTKPQVMVGCQIGATSLAPVSPTSGVEFNGANGLYNLVGCRIYGATNNVLFNAAWTGATVRIFGGDISTSSGSVPISLAGLATDRDVRWANCGVDGYTVNVLSGATVTPDRSQGPQIRIRGTTTGSAYVVAAPTPPPLSGVRDVDLFISFFNNAGGAVTGWTMNAAYHTSAGPSTVNLELTSYHFKWDADAAVWREFSRTVTT